MSKHYNLTIHNYSQFEEIMQAEEPNPTQKLLQLIDYVTNLVVQLSDQEGLILPNLFARVSLLSEQYQLGRAQRWRLNQLCQHTAFKIKQQPATVSQLAQGLKTACLFNYAIAKVEVPPALKQWFAAATDETDDDKHFNIKANLPSARAFIIDCEAEAQTDGNYHYIFAAYLETDNNVGEDIKIRTNVSGFNEHLLETVKIINEEFKNKVMVNLLEITINDKEELLPKFVIVEPDYLIDVTAVAECFGSDGIFSKTYLTRKLIPTDSTLAMTLGNAANFFLDELVLNPRADFNETFKKLFRTDAIRFALSDDSFIRELHAKSQLHFTNLRQLVMQTMSAQQIHKDNAILEPSFYSHNYGLQGRLDLWDYYPLTQKASILELKSGKVFAPNRYGIVNSHYVQTILYGMLTRSVFGDSLETKKYIYYSGAEQDNLKYAPSSKMQEYEAMNARNSLLVWEKKLSDLDRSDYNNTNFLDAFCLNLPRLAPFISSDFELLGKVISDLNDLERAYFISFISFIAKEHQLARIGLANDNSINGIASLWLSPLEDKKEAFAIMDNLRLEHNELNTERQHLSFVQDSAHAQLANFREGDMVVLYPKTNDKDTVMQHQIFKASIAKLEAGRIVLKFNYKQSNAEIFTQFTHWAIEGDMMDKSFTVLYQSLFSFFAYANKSNRELILTRRAPQTPDPSPTATILQRLSVQDLQLSAEQKQTLAKILISKDYFLLIGPPGTGKTKLMLANMVRYLVDWGKTSSDKGESKPHQIILLAYTNRAVDEICEAIHAACRGKYIRLGSKSTSATEYEQEYFSSKIANVQTRKELIKVIEAHQIFVSTISYVANHPEVLKLKRFDTAIIDEASQVLEPMLVGMLHKFGRFILIGDNRQLPAVVQQSKEQSKTNNEHLAAIQLQNRRNSLFERLLVSAQHNGWDWAWSALGQQGRMHKDIAYFASHYFYQDNLSPLLPWQFEPLHFAQHTTQLVAQLLAKKRVVFFPTRLDKEVKTKINLSEATTIAEAVEAFFDLYQQNDRPLQPSDIGIICPYRAQIAQVRAKLVEKNPLFGECTIDTVERYQGGTKKIILLSLCLNNANQLKTLVSLDDTETVDRKLNVALTRAKEHLVIVGNPQFMRLDKFYKLLLEWAK